MSARLTNEPPGINPKELEAGLAIAYDTPLARLEQLRFIIRAASAAAVLAGLIYLGAYFLAPSPRPLIFCGSLIILLALFQMCWYIARTLSINWGVVLFASFIELYLAITIYLQPEVIGANIIIAVTPIVLASYILPPRHVIRVGVISGLGIVHNLAVSILQPFGPMSNPAAAIAINVAVIPIVIYIISFITYRTAARTSQIIGQLREQSTDLEGIVNRRTAQMAAAAEIGRAASSELDPSELMARSLELIRERFGYYHASIFLLDETETRAVVRESTGEIGRQLKERQHTLEVGSQSIIGYVTARREPRIALDVGADAVHFKNPLLPETRSEMAIPLIVGDRLLGALDVQSKEPNAFTAADVTVLQTLADQLATAINNAELFSKQQRLIADNVRLLAETQKAYEELNALTGQLSREGWQSFLASQRGGVVVESGVASSPYSDLALSIAARKGKMHPMQTSDSSVLAAPIVLRGQTIGALAIEEAGAGHKWSDDDMALAKEVADRLALALDNARLVEELNQEQERLEFLFRSSQALAASLELNATIKTVMEFAPALGAEHAYIFALADEGAGQPIFKSTVPGLDHFTGSEAKAFIQAIAKRGLDQWVLTNAAPALISDTKYDERWLAHVEGEPVRSIIIAPLRNQRGAATGALAYTHSLPASFSEDQLIPLDSVSTQVSVALQNAMLYQQLDQQKHSATVLAKATQIMARILNEQQLMQALADELFAAYASDSVVIYRWEFEADTLTPIAAKFAPGETESRVEIYTAIPTSQRPYLMEVMRRRSVWLQRLREEPDNQVRETMSLPFIYNDKVEGVVEIIHTSPSSGFDQEDVELFRSMLTSASNALQSARLYEQLQETADRLREVDRLKSQFLANMSHELRTPLNSIIGFSRVIMKGIDGPVSELQLQDLTAIHHSGQHLLGLINDILDLSKIEAGKMELSYDRVELPEIIKGVLSTTVGLVKDRPIRLIPEIQPDLPPVLADSIRVRQILLNLLSNAAKFTESGSITVRALTRSEGLPHPMVEVMVRDTGAGIAEADIPKLFQSFSQVDGSATRKTGGTGLGLAICKNLVEMHGGQIWVESSINGGAAFFFTLPVYRAEQPVITVQPGDVRPVVLVIDDDARLIDLYRRYLESRGYVVQGLTGGQDAVPTAIQVKPRIILLDVLMRERDGWQTLQDLKRNDETKGIPVVICSVLAEQGKGLSLGASDYLVKPILDVDLYAAIDRLNGQVAKRESAVVP
jgi:signal transduction histidine kinase/putative methionine-R-sulfoxide reductase with GAF domain/ActR/RegA family two-component response regulator